MLMMIITGMGWRTYAAERTNEIIMIGQVLELARLQNPELVAMWHNARAAEGAAWQAGAWPNPELELEAAEFGGWGTRPERAGFTHLSESGGSSGTLTDPAWQRYATALNEERMARQENGNPRKGYNAAQTTVRLSQSVELGGKRNKRQRVAQSEARLAVWEYEAKLLDVLTQAKKAFVDVLLAQGQLDLAESLLVLADDVRKAAAERVKAGKVALLEETRAGIEVANARIVRDGAKRELDTARRCLAASWGGRTSAFKAADGDWGIVRNVPAMEACLARLDATPEVACWNEEVVLARASLAAAKAERIPDLNVSAGISRFEEDGSYAATAAFSLPLPLFDRKAGGILAAEHLATRAEHERNAVRLRAMTALAEAHNRLETARGTALTIKTELLPGAQQAFDAAQTGYREGKFGHLDVLDSQRTLSEAKVRYLNVLASYHKAAADVERLTGTSFNTIQ